ncbi:MAG: phosphatidate cytidylyltransferase [Kiritimatiellia bacterium]
MIAPWGRSSVAEGVTGKRSGPRLSRVAWRIVSGCVVGTALLLAVLRGPEWLLWAILLMASTISQLEFYALVNKAGIPVFRIFGVVSGAALISVTFWLEVGSRSIANGGWSTQWENLVLLASLMAVCLRQFPQKFNDKPLGTIACSLLGVWYIPYLLNYFMHLLRLGSSDALNITRTGRLAALYLLVVVKSADIGAYVVGSLCGRHKVWPRISPGKTWEGVAGALVVALLASWAFAFFNGGRLGEIPMTLPRSLVLGSLLAASGFWGDLFESLLKRAAGVKDSGNLLPGLGGLLDVVDSLLFAVPVFYIFLGFAVRVGS